MALIKTEGEEAVQRKRLYKTKVYSRWLLTRKKREAVSARRGD
jgi:hypothetical protein